LVFELVGLVNELLLGAEVEGFRCEADVGLEKGGCGEELFEDGGVLADEFDGPEGQMEGAFDD